MMAVAADQPRGAPVPWTRPLTGQPFAVAANATVVQNFPLSPGARLLVLGLSAFANVTALTVTGLGTGALLYSTQGAPVGAYVPVPVVPSLDDYVSVSVSCGAAGGCTVYGAEVDDTASGGALSGGFAPFTAVYLYNQATWDVEQANALVPVVTAAGRGASGGSSQLTNATARGAYFYVNVSAVAGTAPTLSFVINGVDPGSGSLFSLAPASGNITAAGQYLIAVYPGISGIGFQSVNGPLPRIYTLSWTIGGTAPNFTFSVEAAYMR